MKGRNIPTLPWPGPGCFRYSGSSRPYFHGRRANGLIDPDGVHGTGAARRNPTDPTDPNALHPDQRRYKNLTRDQVRRLEKMVAYAKWAIDHAIRRLQEVIGAEANGANVAERWDREIYHCWWGWFEPRRSLRGAMKCLKRYQKMRDRLGNSRCRFKFSNQWYSRAIPPYRICLSEKFFEGSESWQWVTTIIHETAHLVGILGDTYHRGACLDKAENTPALARLNADNYAFFAVDCYRNHLKWLAMDDPDRKLTRYDPTGTLPGLM